MTDGPFQRPGLSSKDLTFSHGRDGTPPPPGTERRVGRQDNEDPIVLERKSQRLLAPAERKPTPIRLPKRTLKSLPRAEREAETENAERISLLTNLAQDDARIQFDQATKLKDKEFNDAESRIKLSLEARLVQCIAEDLILADQINSNRYLSYVSRLDGFLDSKNGGTACSDDRIAPHSIIDRVMSHLHRRLRGMPETKETKKGSGEYEIADQLTLRSLTRAVKSIPEKLKSVVEFIEFVGPHINSADPLNGCGAARKDLDSSGRRSDTDMLRFGGIRSYFHDLGKRFLAFNNTLRQMGIPRSTTIDMTHDAYSQGEIYGLRKLFYSDTTGNIDGQKSFDPDLPLRENLINLHQRGEILMTELLANDLQRVIEQAAINKGISRYLDLDDPRKFADNMITIGDISMDLTKKFFTGELAGLVDQLPQYLTNGSIDRMSDKAKRSLVYHAIRNSVYTILGDIIPGEHNLITHLPQLVRVGPIGPQNLQVLSLIQAVAHGTITDKDIEGTQTLDELVFGHSAHNVGIKFDKEATTVLVTGDCADGESRAELINHAIMAYSNAKALKESPRFQAGLEHGHQVFPVILFDRIQRRARYYVAVNPDDNNSIIITDLSTAEQISAPLNTGQAAQN